MRTTLALLLLLGAGCTIDEQQSWAPLRPRGPITTEGGAQLEADPDGRILWRPAQDDLDASIGALLEDDPGGGVRVVGLLAAEGPLEVDDVIRAVRARPTPLPARGDDAPVSTARGVSRLPEGGGRRPAPEPLPRLVPPALADIQANGHPVRGLADLRGYALCPCTLDLAVLRGGEEVALRAELTAGRPLEAPPWAPTWTRELGFEAVRVGDLPRQLRPDQVIGGDDDLLVTFVGEGSTIGLRGLRPLDVIPHGARELTKAWPYDQSSRVVDVWRAREPAPRRVDFTPAPSFEERSSFAPLFETSRPTPTHFRASSGAIVANLVDLEERWTYVPRTDRYERALRVDVGPVLPLLFRLDVEDGDGLQDETKVGLGVFDVQLLGEAE